MNNESESSRGKAGWLDTIASLVFPLPALSLDVCPPDRQSVPFLGQDPQAAGPSSSENPSSFLGHPVPLLLLSTPA